MRGQVKHIRYILVYFSGTGNTELVTKELENELVGIGKEVSVYSVEQFNSKTELDLTDAVLGIGFPVYKFTYPEIMERIMPLLERSACGKKAQPFFVYSTYCRFEASSLHKMAARVEKLGLTLVAKRSFKCPSNGISSLKDVNSTDYKTVMYFENHIDMGIRNFAKTIVKNTDTFLETGKGIRHHGGLADNLKIKIVGQVEKSRYPELRVDQTTCNTCNICVKGCPENNLTCEQGKIIIGDSENCLHCLRCMHRCPTHSITFGDLVFGPNRYLKKIRNKLYEGACEMIGDMPEPGTRKIKKRWALNNLKYWLFHK